jgi:hypothetical protein
LHLLKNCTFSRRTDTPQLCVFAAASIGVKLKVIEEDHQSIPPEVCAALASGSPRILISLPATVRSGNRFNIS